MKPALLIILAIATLEGGVQMWRKHGLEPSHAPLFSWRDAKLVTSAPPPFGRALEIYRADRGMERFDQLAAGVTLQWLYLEWDDIETGPFAALAGHESEVCNVTAGFTVIESRVPRTYVTSGGEQLEFHYARLKDASGATVHAYKLPWIQGVGAWHVDSSRDRTLRLQRSFIRHRGAARVVQAGVFGVNEESAAWEMVKEHLDSSLDWR